MPATEPETLKWLRKAAEQGNAFSQFNLGVAYAKGRGVEKNFIEAYKWLDLSATARYDEAPELRDVLSKKMEPPDLAKAQRMARKWLDKKREKEQTAK